MTDKIGKYIRNFYLLQSKHSTSQCNGQKLTCCGHRWRHMNKILTSKLIFNPLLFAMNRKYLCWINILFKVRLTLIQNIRLKSDAMIYWVKFIIHLYDFCILTQNELKINFEIRVSIQCFRRRDITTWHHVLTRVLEIYRCWGQDR